jgi:hypothetical protein
MGIISEKGFIVKITVLRFPWGFLAFAVPTLIASAVHFRYYQQWSYAIAVFSGPAFK